MAALPTYLPIPEAAHKYGMEESRLHTLVETGKIGAAVAMGEVIVNEDEVRDQMTKKEDLPEYRKHAHLKGSGLGIAEAGRKYNIPTTTIYQWTQNGYILRLGRQGQKVLLNEQDVAYCAEIYHKTGKQGRRLFNPDGTPFRAKTNPLAG